LVYVFAMDAPGWSTEIVGGLARVHAVLRRSLETILRVTSGPIPESDRAGFADFTERFTRFLEVHHDGEEEVVFPVLTAAAERASADGPAGSVTGWRADHQKLLARLAALKTASAEFGRGGSAEALRGAALEVREILLPHLDAEEATLDGALLAKLLPKDEALEMLMAASKHGQQHGGPKVLMMFVHALSDDEQRAHFAQLPWFVRKILMKRVWSRDFRPCLKFAHNPSVAL
jgi:hemerythrin-like domain-containing protein